MPHFFSFNCLRGACHDQCRARRAVFVLSCVADWLSRDNPKGTFRVMLELRLWIWDARRRALVILFLSSEGISPKAQVALDFGGCYDRKYSWCWSGPFLASHCQGCHCEVFSTGIVYHVELFKLYSSVSAITRHQRRLFGVPHAGTSFWFIGVNFRE